MIKLTKCSLGVKRQLPTHSLTHSLTYLLTENHISHTIALRNVKEYDKLREPYLKNSNVGLYNALLLEERDGYMIMT